MSVCESVKSSPPKETAIMYKPASFLERCFTLLKRDFVSVPEHMSDSDIIRYATLSHLWDLINDLCENDHLLDSLTSDITCINDLDTIENYYNYKLKKNDSDLYCISGIFDDNGNRCVITVELPVIGTSDTYFTIDTTATEFKKRFIKKTKF